MTLISVSLPPMDAVMLSFSSNTPPQSITDMNSIIISFFFSETMRGFRGKWGFRTPKSHANSNLSKAHSKFTQNRTLTHIPPNRQTSRKKTWSAHAVYMITNILFIIYIFMNNYNKFITFYIHYESNIKREIGICLYLCYHKGWILHVHCIDNDS